MPRVRGNVTVESGLAAFSDGLDVHLWAVDMFDSIPDIYFYIKDKHCRWMTCNEASLRLLGIKRRESVHGITEHDFFPKAIADAIRADDLAVIERGERIVGRTEVILDEFGLLTWVSTNKLPLKGKSGEIVGLMGTTRVLRRYDDLPDAYRPFRRVIAYVQTNLASEIEVTALAKESNLSVSQFRRRFHQIFSISPSEFIVRTRLQTAARMLSNTDSPLINIALECGFCDQSYFTKRFRDFFGVTPKAYRRSAPHLVDVAEEPGSVQNTGVMRRVF